MTGKQVRKKIRDKGFTYRAVAQAIGESDQSFRNLLMSDNIKTGTLERIATAMNENVAYFYNQQPIFTLVDYVEYEARKKENELLRMIILEKERLIEELKKSHFQN